MRNILILTKIFLKNSGDIFGKNNKIKKLKTAGIILLMIAGFTPIIFGVGALVYGIYDSLAAIGQQGYLIGISMIAVCLSVFIFGIMYILNYFYFSKDLEYLLPLPVKPYEILAAKFLVVTLWEYLTQSILFLPIIIAYGLRSSSGISYYLTSLVVFIFLPVIPLIAALIINMILMRFTSIGKHKERFKLIIGIFGIFIGIGINTLSQRLAQSNMTQDKIQELINQGNNSLLGQSSGLFPSAKFAANAIINSGTTTGLLNLVIFLIMTIVLLLMVLTIGQSLYFKGAMGVSEAPSNRKKLSNKEFTKSTSESSILKAYVMKEFRMLFRTSVYFLNCVLMNFLWPVFVLIPIFSKPDSLEGLSALGTISLDGGFGGLALVITFVMVMFLASSNSIAGTAISREGQNAIFMKYIPVDYTTQIIAKIFPAIILSLVSVIMLIVISLFVIKLPMILLVLSVIVAFIAIIFNSLTGIIVDMKRPKLDWDNEQKAVKQNLNGLINMGISLISAVFIALVVILNLSLVPTFLMLLIIYGTFDFMLYFYIKKNAEKIFRRIE